MAISEYLRRLRAKIGTDLLIVPSVTGVVFDAAGRMLLEHALREAPRWSIDRLMAFIWHDNAASVGLFRAHGFSAWGSLPGIVWADARSRDIIASRWLGEEKATLHELAAKYKVSAERIRQLESNAMNKVKALLEA